MIITPTRMVTSIRSGAQINIKDDKIYKSEALESEGRTKSNEH